MHDDKRDQFVDDLLEASLERYRGEEPRSGLEMRILAGIRTRQRAARRRSLGWAVAVGAGALATIVLALHFAPNQHRQPAPSAALPQPVANPPAMPLQQPPPSLADHRAPLQPPQQQVRRVATPRLRPEQFPTPYPLTEQEKLLLAYLDKATKPDSVAGTTEHGADEARVSDLEIPGIKIAALEIKPLDDSQSEQEK
jgi:hypothetical protein